ncbi:MAG TPA: asparagine synthase-related protein, partial [Candidatus Nitrosocosmicus sp.]|nr:asparagine synthase-related protein [Candidatus Nitrosocosmicus sp.]
REAVRDLLPEKIVNRRNKIGFTTPEYEWFLKEKHKVREIFESKSFGSRKYFNQTQVLNAWTDFENKKNTDTMLFWRLINVEMWMREFID